MKCEIKKEPARMVETVRLNPNYRWWKFWQSKYLVYRDLVPDPEGDHDIEYISIDAEGKSMEEVYKEFQEWSRR